MITVKKKFQHGYARPVHRGVSFWLDPDKKRNTTLDQLVYEALGDEYDLGYGADLEGITISIAIDKATRPDKWLAEQSG